MVMEVGSFFSYTIIVLLEMEVTVKNSGSSRLCARIAPAIVILLIAFLYIDTCAKDIVWNHHAQDTGDIITAAHTLGIAHPTGYPLFTLIGHLFTRIDLGALSNKPVPINNSAFKMTLMVLLMSLVNLWLFMKVHLRLYEEPGSNDKCPPRNILSAALSALVLGTGYLYWSQSIVPEVYILNLLFINLALWLLLKFSNGKASKNPSLHFLLLGVAVGCGIFHHLIFLLAIPGLFLLAAVSLKKPGIKGVLAVVTGLVISFLPVLYFPIRSALNPALDTSNPETFGNFIHHITARAYHNYLFSEPLGQTLQHLRNVDLWDHFGWTGIALLYTGIIAGILSKSRLLRLFTIACILSGFLAAFHASNYEVSDREVFFLPVYFWATHLIGIGLYTFFNYVYSKTSGVKTFRKTVIAFMLIAFSVLWIFGQIRQAYDRNIDISESMTAKSFGSRAFAEIDEGGIVLTWFDGQSYSLIYHRYVLFEGIRDDVDIVLLQQIGSGWWRENVMDGHPNIEMDIEYPASRTEIVENIIRSNIGKRPVYTAWPLLPIPGDFKIVKTGNLFRIIPTDEYEKMMINHSDFGMNGQTDQENRSNDSSGTSNSM